MHGIKFSPKFNFADCRFLCISPPQIFTNIMISDFSAGNKFLRVLVLHVQCLKTWKYNAVFNFFVHFLNLCHEATITIQWLW